MRENLSIGSQRHLWVAVLIGAAIGFSSCTGGGPGATSGSAGAAIGASAGSASGTTTPLCVPGLSVGCVGPQACKGYQVCNQQGTGFDPCVCGSDSDSDAPSGASTGTSSGGTAGTSSGAGTGTAGSGSGSATGGSSVQSSGAGSGGSAGAVSSAGSGSGSGSSIGNTSGVDAGTGMSCGSTGSSSSSDGGVPLSGVTAISAGWDHACALLSDGTVACWGDNISGQLGTGNTTRSLTPMAVPNLTGVTAIATGREFTCALLSNGTVECWGLNTVGELGIGTTSGPDQCTADTCLTIACILPTRSDCSLTPVPVPNLTGVTAISAKVDDVCVLLSDGTDVCWGQIPSYPTLPTPGATPSAAMATAVCADCELLSGGAVACFGSSPVLTGATAITCGGNHDCALLSDGTAECWGVNNYGDFGSATPPESAGWSQGGPVPNLTSAIAISAGLSHTCVLLSDTTVECWGDNQFGELGIGTPDPQLTPPFRVCNLAGATAISTGTYFTCALLSDTRVECWGDNASGAIGSVSYPGLVWTPVPILL
jgi:hypothetical protein